MSDRLRTISVLAAAALALAGAAAAPAAESPRPWPFRKPIVLPALAHPALIEVAVDPEVAREAQPSLADLRIRDTAGGDVPYRIRRHETTTAETARETPPLDLVAAPDGTLRLVLDAGESSAGHRGVRLAVRESARNFRVPVRVEMAEQGGGWQIAREAGFVYRIEADTKTADTSVSYRPSRARFVRVTIGADHGRSLPLGGAALLPAATPGREEERVAATILSRDQETIRRTTRLVLDRRSGRPVDRVELDVAEQEFQRVVLVEASEDRTRWRFIGSGAISAVERPTRERATSVRFPETTARYLRLTIQNLADPPLSVAAARLFAVKRSLVFEAVPGHSYVLDYGHPTAAAPASDPARATDARGAAATLGAPQPLLGKPAAADLGSAPLAAWATGSTALLALGSLLWRLARGVRLAD